MELPRSKKNRSRKRRRKNPNQRKKRNAKSRRRRKRKLRLRKSRRKSGAGSAGNRATRSNPLSHNSTNRHFIFPRAISSQATLAGEPWFGRVTQPGFRNNTPPRFSFRGTCV